MNNLHLVQTFIEGYLTCLQTEINQEEERIVQKIRSATTYVDISNELSALVDSKTLSTLVRQVLDEKRFGNSGHLISKIVEGTLDSYDVRYHIEHSTPMVATVSPTPLSASEVILAYVKEHNLKAPSAARLSGLAEEVEIYAAENHATFEEVVILWKENLERALQ